MEQDSWQQHETKHSEKGASLIISVSLNLCGLSTKQSCHWAPSARKVIILIYKTFLWSKNMIIVILLEEQNTNTVHGHSLNADHPSCCNIPLVKMNN